MGSIRRSIRCGLLLAGPWFCLGSLSAAQELSVPLSHSLVPRAADAGRKWRWQPEGQPLQPIAIDVHSSGVICGLEGRRNRLFVTESDGHWIGFADRGAGDLALGFATQVCAGLDLRLFALDGDERTLDLYDLRGRWEQRLDLGRIVEEAGFSLLAPRGIAVDRAGNIYLLDGEAGRLFRFEAKGLGVAALGDWADWSAHRPVALEVDGRGNLYLLESSPGGVRVLDPDGQVLHWRALPEPRPADWRPDVLEVDLWGNLFLAMKGQPACWIGSATLSQGVWASVDLQGGVCDLAADEAGRLLALGCARGWVQEIRLQYGRQGSER